MKTLRYLTVLTCAAPLFGAYTYYSTENWESTISGNWTQNGAISASGGLTSASANGGSLISNVAVPCFSVENCVTLFSIIGSASTFPNQTYLYDLAEQNSNSLTHALLVTQNNVLPWQVNLKEALNARTLGWLWPLNW